MMSHIIILMSHVASDFGRLQDFGFFLERNPIFDFVRFFCIHVRELNI